MVIKLSSGKVISVVCVRTTANIDLFNKVGFDCKYLSTHEDSIYISFDPFKKRIYSFLNLPKKEFIVLSQVEVTETLLLGSIEAFTLYVESLDENRIFDKSTDIR